MLRDQLSRLSRLLYRKVLKALIDRALAAVLLVILAPMLLLLALAVRLFLGSPVFFRQPRPGLGSRVFTLVKFRTMTEGQDALGQSLPDPARQTRFGTWLRASSLDELPELINVVRGEMSLVGPRPLLCAYLERYSLEQARRHEVKPGITGWAQVNGRNALSWEDKFRLDVWYVDHYSLSLDLKILIATICKTLLRQGITEAGQPTVREFMGSQK